MPTKSNITNVSNDILIAEYEYIANSAIQANEDRARVASFYLVAVGSLVAALFSAQIFNVNENFAELNFLFAGLFLALTLLGGLTVIQLARLRAAWYESMKALNQIKDYFIAKDKQVAKAFRWTGRSLPPLHKKRSISYQQTLEVAILSGMMFGAAMRFFLLGLGLKESALGWSLIFIGAIASFFIQLFIYKYFLTHTQKDE
ncbi:MAG: hypothetical protein IT310_02010 [Anaerolineales bacterium]|nr:hypothetical protein [Anaerolineales bacterium]